MKQFISYLLGVAMLLVYACAGPAGDIGPAGIQGPTGPTGPQGPEGARLRGDIAGKALLTNTRGNLIQDHSGVLVTVKGTEPLITATSNAAGSYTLSAVPTGTYDLVYTKATYGRHEVNGFKQVGGTTIYANGMLAPVSQAQVSSLSVAAVRATTTDGSLAWTITVSGLLTGGDFFSRNIHFYLNTQPDVSVTSHTYRNIRSESRDRDPRADYIQYTMTVDVTSLANAKAGDTVYLVVQTQTDSNFGYDVLAPQTTPFGFINDWVPSSYYDTRLKYYVPTALSTPSPVFALKLP